MRTHPRKWCWCFIVPLSLAWPTADAGHGAFTPSSALYRIPYQDGLAVSANNDHHTHPNAFNRVDLGGGAGNNIVAAASGIIRAAVDWHGDGVAAGDGMGDGFAADGVTANDDTMEHACGDDDDVVGDCSDYNNYVWIEHPNGEWTKYTHFATGSVSANNWEVGDTILVGQVIGQESDIGSASGPHLHFEVAVPNDPNDDTPFSDLGGFVQGVNVVTQLCSSTGFNDGDDDNDGMYTQGENYIAGPCDNTAPTADSGGPYVVNEGGIANLDGTGSSDPENAILNYSWSPGGIFNDPTLAEPSYDALDDAVENVDLTVNDFGGDVTGGTQLEDTDSTTITVNNVAPTVMGPDQITHTNEGLATPAMVSISFFDPGSLDTHSATVDWDDGSPMTVVDPATSPFDVQHAYGDNGQNNVVATVTDDDGGSGDDLFGITVHNVAPTVTATGDTIDEGQMATVSATFTDPGWLDTHTAAIDWDDGTSAQAVSIAALNSGVQHVYGDNGDYTVTVTVTDDDGGMGTDTPTVTVNNLDPVLTLDLGDQVGFPGGDFFVVQVNSDIDFTASGTDPGSDDLTFDWNTGDENIHYNNGVSPDPLPSPLGTFPFMVNDDTATGNFGMPGVETAALTLYDDDGGSDDADANVIVTGDADMTQGNGWWKHQFSGSGSPHIEADVAQGYLDIVNAVSGVFSEMIACANAGEAHEVLSTEPRDARARAEAALLEAWLQFASGAVGVADNVPLGGQSQMNFLALMFAAEAVIADGSATKNELQEVENHLSGVRQASP